MGVQMKDPYVIFDRDGTLIEHIHHLINPELVVFKDGMLEALANLQDHGFKFGIISNQSVIGRRLASRDTVNQINNKITNYLNLHGIEMQFVLLCPHLPEEGCVCRKPNPGLGHIAEKNFGVPLNKSYVVGDQESDLQFGINLHCKVIQVHNDSFKSALANYYSSTLTGAADWIIQDSRKD